MTEHETRPLDGMAFATRAVHAGERPPHPDYTPVVTPIYPGSSFAYDDMAVVDDIFAATREGYAYTRYGNPTNSAMEDAVAALEGTEAAMGFGSGMAALHGAFLGTGVQAGDTVVASRECYGATTTLLQGYLARLGVRTTFVDMLDLAAVEEAVGREQPKFVTFETVSNPLLHVADGPAITEIAHRAGALVVVDNTFTTPVLMRPVAVGRRYGRSLLHQVSRRARRRDGGRRRDERELCATNCMRSTRRLAASSARSRRGSYSAA